MITVQFIASGWCVRVLETVVYGCRHSVTNAADARAQHLSDMFGVPVRWLVS